MAGWSMPKATNAAALAALLGATALTACGGGGDLLLPGAGDPASVTVLQGDQQNGRVGEPLPQPLLVSVADASGRPVAGATVLFVLTGAAAGATVDPDTAVTQSDGTASAQVVLGTEPGTITGEARALGDGGGAAATAPFTLTAVPKDANGIRSVSGDGQTATVGSALPDPLVVEVDDAFGNPIPGVTVAWSVDGGGSASDAQTVTGDDGRTSVTRMLGGAAGTQRTFATVDGLAGSPVTFVATATSGSAQGVSVVSGNNQSGPVSTELPTPLVVAVLDAGQNPVPGVAVTWVVRTGGGSVTPATSTTDASGQATAVWTLGAQPGPNTLGAVVSGIGVAEFSATAQAGAPARLTIRTQPSATTTSGTPLAQQPVIQLLDAQGNPTGQSGVDVTVAIGSGAATLSGTTTKRTDANGRATFTDLALRGAPGAVTLRFSATGFASVTSAPITLTAAPTTTQITADDPDPSLAGENVTVKFTVTAAVGTPTGSVRVSDGAATCSGTLSNGKGSCLLPLTATGDRTLTADYAGGDGFGPSSDAEPHRVNAAAPPSLAIARQPAAQAQSGVPLDPQPIVQLKAGDGSDLAAAGVAVSVVLSGGGTLGGTTIQATDANGRATFTDLVITGDAGTRTLTFTAQGYGNVTSSGISLQPVPPSGSTSSVAAAPDTILATTESSTITVTVRDGGGAPLSGRVVALSASGSGNSIAPGSAATDGNGVATFTFGSSVAETKSLTATSEGVALGAAQVTVVLVPTSTSIIGDNPDPSVERSTVEVAFLVTSALGTPRGDVTVTSDREKASCRAPASAGRCSLALKTRGTHTLTASFAGAGEFADSSGNATHEVVERPHGQG
jgi:hypothetical protein